MNKSRLLEMGILGILPAVASCTGSQENSANGNSENKVTDDRPNILMITCEDINPILGCYGDKAAKTPNLDAFAKEAILHTDMYTCNGVSSPSRYALITGRYSSNDGANFMRVNAGNPHYQVAPADGVKCYTEYLRKEGYYCTNNEKTDYQFRNPIYAWDENGKQAHWKHAPAGQPFFAIFNLFETHESQIWQTADQPILVNPADIEVPPYYPDTETVRHDMAIVYSMVARMDKRFGELLDELEASGKADNTIVIFFSDNGGPLPRQKREIKDSGTKVPFMIRFPDRRGAGTKNTDLNMFVDIPSTVLSLAGIQPAETMQGIAMYGKYASENKREYVFSATDRFDAMVEKRGGIRNDRYLYIYNYMPEQSLYQPNAYRRNMPMMVEMEEMYSKGQLNAIQSQWFDAPAPQEELYDCSKDPHQINNLVLNPEYATVLAKMREAYRKEWIEPYNAKWVSYTEAQFKEESQPGGQIRLCPRPDITCKNSVYTWNNPDDNFTLCYQIDGKGASGKEKQWNIYTHPVNVDPSAETVTFALSRIGYKDNTVTFRNNR